MLPLRLRKQRMGATPEEIPDSLVDLMRLNNTHFDRGNDSVLDG